MARKPVSKLTVEALKHDDATRKNISMAEISEDVLAVLGGDIFCPLDKPSKVGAGDTASEVLNGYISRPLDTHKFGRITVEVINHLVIR